MEKSSVCAPPGGKEAARPEPPPDSEGWKPASGVHGAEVQMCRCSFIRMGKKLFPFLTGMLRFNPGGKWINEKWDDCLGHDGNSSVWCLTKFLKHGICRWGVRSVMGFIMLLITKMINTHSSRFNKKLQNESCWAWNGRKSVSKSDKMKDKQVKSSLLTSVESSLVLTWKQEMGSNALL